MAVIALTACQTTTDPAEGGFFSGVSAINSGAYDARIRAAEGDLAADQTRNAELAREVARLEAELSALKSRIRQQQTQSRSIDTLTQGRVDRVLEAEPTGTTDQERLSALAKAIEDARNLSADLARLAG